MIIPLSRNAIPNSHKLNENGLFDKPPKLKDYCSFNGNTVADDLTDVSYNILTWIICLYMSVLLFLIDSATQCVLFFRFARLLC